MLLNIGSEIANLYSLFAEHNLPINTINTKYTMIAMKLMPIVLKFAIANSPKLFAKKVIKSNK